MSLSADDFFANIAKFAFQSRDDDYPTGKTRSMNAARERILGSRLTSLAYPTYMSYYSETGSAWYEANSDTKSMPNARCDGESNRWETNVGSSWNDKGFEVCGYLKPSGGSMSSDGHIGLKHGGPNHTPPCDYKVGDKCCCWWDGGLREDGASYLEIEYPHPDNKRRSYYSNMGRHIDNGSMLGVRWSLKKLSGYHIRRLRLWVDTSGGKNYKWRKMYDYTDSGGKMPQSYAITSNQNIEIRVSDIACSKVNWQWGPYCRKMV